LPYKRDESDPQKIAEEGTTTTYSNNNNKDSNAPMERTHTHHEALTYTQAYHTHTSKVNKCNVPPKAQTAWLSFKKSGGLGLGHYFRGTFPSFTASSTKYTWQ